MLELESIVAVLLPLVKSTLSVLDQSPVVVGIVVSRVDSDSELELESVVLIVDTSELSTVEL